MLRCVDDATLFSCDVYYDGDVDARVPSVIDIKNSDIVYVPQNFCQQLKRQRESLKGDALLTWYNGARPVTPTQLTQKTLTLFT